MGKFIVDRGTTFTIDVAYTDNGVPASLVGATVRFTVKSTEYDATADDSTAVITKDITSHTDAPNGLSAVIIDPVDTATLEPGKYFYDVKVAEAGGAVYKVDEGTLKLDGSPTNRLV